MYISEPMVRYYLANVLLSWFNNHDTPPAEIEEYYEYVLDMKKAAIKHGDLEVLQIALEYILSNQSIDCASLNEGFYPYTNEEVREIIDYSYRVIWPEFTPKPADSLASVKLVPVSLQKWWESRQQLTQL